MCRDKRGRREEILANFVPTLFPKVSPTSFCSLFIFSVLSHSILATLSTFRSVDGRLLEENQFAYAAGEYIRKVQLADVYQYLLLCLRLAMADLCRPFFRH